MFNRKKSKRHMRNSKSSKSNHKTITEMTTQKKRPSISTQNNSSEEHISNAIWSQISWWTSFKRKLERSTGQTIPEFPRRTTLRSSLMQSIQSTILSRRWALRLEDMSIQPKTNPTSSSPSTSSEETGTCSGIITKRSRRNMWNEIT